MKKISTLFFGLILFSSVSFGQYYYLKYPSPGQNPGGLNTDDEYPVGGGLSATWANVIGPSITTPAWSAVQSIPFAFNFNGSPVTQYKVSSTGVLTFTTGAVTVPGASHPALPSASIPDASVCIWGVQTKGTNDYAVKKTFGTAPNRQHWIMYASCDLGGGTSWTYWSIVLEETSNKIYIVDQRHSGTSGGVTAGIQINSSTAVSITGSPALAPLATTDPTPADNVYYEFIQGSQPANDAALTSLTNAPYAAAGNLNITGVISNLGANTITAMDVTYNAGAGPQTQNLTGLNIASGGTYNLSHSIPLNVVAGNTYTVNVDVVLTGDANTSNNSGSEVIVGLSSIPPKKTVGEEKTGTWCGWCPRGAVGLAYMEAQPDFIGIAVHNGDAMTISAYDGNIGTYIPGGYPGGGVDRVLEGDPNPTSFLSMHNARKNTVVPCDVKNILATLNTVTNQISVSADSEWFGTISGNYRLSCVIVEDNFNSSNQSNYYAGGGNGPMAFPAGKNNSYDFGGTSSPSSVPSSAFLGYDHVAKSLSGNSILGNAGSLPAGSVSIGVHSYTFANVPGSVISNVSNAHAVVMVINATTGEILNAEEAPIQSINSTDDLEANKYALNIYPNPTNSLSTVTFELTDNSLVTMDVFNTMGSLVYTSGATNMASGKHNLSFNGTDLPNGIYFVNLTIGNELITKKVSLLK